MHIVRGRKSDSALLHAIIHHEECGLSALTLTQQQDGFHHRDGLHEKPERPSHHAFLGTRITRYLGASLVFFVVKGKTKTKKNALG